MSLDFSIIFLAVAFVVMIVLLFVGMYFVFRLATCEKRKTVLRCECGYNLRGSIAAGKTACPECGKNVVE
jgi:hypothetical protein